MRYDCDSEISAVVVYARGAVVTRTVAVPSIEAGDLDLVVGGVPWSAEAGTVRARVVAEGRRVVSVQSSPVVPSERAIAARSEQPVIEAKSALARARAERIQLERRHSALLGLGLDPGLAPRAHGDKIAERTRDAMIAHDVVARSLEADGARIVALEERIAKLELAVRAAEVAKNASSTQDRRETGRAEREIVVRIEGSGPIDELEVSYVVRAARWWPMYTLEINDAKAALWLEALVAQETGEDWSGVGLGLSTSDLVTDARLPELPSLRFGKAQPRKRAGYRPPPGGLDRLFAGYDRVSIKTKIVVEQRVTIEHRYEETAPMAPSRLMLDDALVAADEPQWDEVTGSSGAPAAMELGSMPLPSGGFGGAPGAAAKMSSRPMKDERARGAPAPARSMSAMRMSTGSASSFSEGGGGGAPPSPEPLPRDDSPDDNWLDFDRLRLGAPASGHRGRLHYVGDDDGASSGRSAIEILSPGDDFHDPRSSRGHYDHRWDSEGRVHVPSDAEPHRLRLASFDARPRYRFWTVPRETAEVFREASVDNPMPGPLLSGPMDVYIDGSLLMTAPIANVDRGGVVRVGLGVEERLRVARNVRIDEDSAGLLGGSTAVDHHIAIELTSSLGQPATVEVFDRVPVTDEKGLEVKVVAEDPASEPYKQEDRGAPIRGGVRWRVALAPGAKRSVKCHYKLVFSAKNELVGGNRRE